MNDIDDQIQREKEEARKQKRKREEADTLPPPEESDDLDSTREPEKPGRPHDPPGEVFHAAELRPGLPWLPTRPQGAL